MKTISIDENAHKILLDWKKDAINNGFEKPSHSDAIRWGKDKIELLENKDKK